jgi:hypothetical protein
LYFFAGIMDFIKIRKNIIPLEAEWGAHEHTDTISIYFLLKKGMLAKNITVLTEVRG